MTSFPLTNSSFVSVTGFRLQEGNSSCSPQRTKQMPTQVGICACLPLFHCSPGCLLPERSVCHVCQDGGRPSASLRCRRTAEDLAMGKPWSSGNLTGKACETGWLWTCTLPGVHPNQGNFKERENGNFLILSSLLHVFADISSQCLPGPGDFFSYSNS